MNLGEDELFISHRMVVKSINGVHDRKIFLKTTRKELTHRICHATCEVNPPFYINYYLIHTRCEFRYFIRQLKKHQNIIELYHLYKNETCTHYNTCDYISIVSSTPSLIETENRTIHVTNRTLADLERFI